VHDEGRPESPQSNTRERGREKGCAKRHLFTHHARGKTGEALGREEEHKEVGDGWQEFRKGGSLLRVALVARLTPKGRVIHFPDFFRDSITHATVSGL
jgi:hypothetical protein